MFVALVGLSLSSTVTPGFNEHEEPLGLCYLATWAKKFGHEVILLQQTVESDELIIEKLLSYGPDIVGFTSVSALAPRTIVLAKAIKKTRLATVTIIGGSHACAFPEESSQFFDFVVVGEGEITFCSLLDYIEKGGNLDFPGVCVRRGGRTIFTGYPKRLHDLDSNWPFREGLPIEYYNAAGSPPVPYKTNGFAAIIGSRGCLHNCVFCSNQSIWTNGNSKRSLVVYRSPMDIIYEMQYLLAEKNINYIVFEDTDFLARPYQELFELSKLMAKHCLGMKWACMGRLDRILPEWPATNADLSRAKKLLSTMQEGGCHLICLGVESGDDGIRHNLGRAFTDEWIETVFQLAYKSKIMATALLMLGYPTESRTSLHNTRKLSMRLNAIRLRISYFYPFGKTDIAGHSSIKWIYPKYAEYQYATTEIPTVKCEVTKEELIDFKETLLRDFYTSQFYLDRLKEISCWDSHWAATMQNWQNQLQKMGYKLPCL